MKKLNDLLEGKNFKISQNFYVGKPVESGLLIEYAQKLGGRTGGDTDDGKWATAKGKAFKTVLDFFIYAAFLGIKANKRIPFAPNEKTDTPFQIFKDSRLKESTIPFLIMAVLANSETSLLEIEQMDEAGLTDFSASLATAIEEYANTGFYLIQERQSDNEQFFEDPNNFVVFSGEVGRKV